MQSVLCGKAGGNVVEVASKVGGAVVVLECWEILPGTCL